MHANWSRSMTLVTCSTAVRTAWILIHAPISSVSFYACWTNTSSLALRIEATCSTPISLAVSLIIFPRSRLLLKYTSNISSLVSSVLNYSKVSSGFTSKFLMIWSMSVMNTFSNFLRHSSLNAALPNVLKYWMNSFQKEVWYLAFMRSWMILTSVLYPMPISWSRIFGTRWSPWSLSIICFKWLLPI